VRYVDAVNKRRRPHPMLNRRQVLGAAGAALVLGPRVGMAQAAGPSGPITIVVPYTPGTGHDIVARLLSPSLARRLGQPVVVDNRAGASGNIGAQYVSRAAPDGRTLMLQGNAHTMNPALFPNLSFNPETGFTPIARLTTAQLALCVNPDVRAQDVRAFVAAARSKPGDIDYGSPGNGTPHHMAMALFSLAAGVELNHVPYRGTAPAIQDLLGRRLGAMMVPVHVALPLAQAGQIRMLALAALQRSPVASDLPTLAEAGFPVESPEMWYGLLGPPNMAPGLAQRLNSEAVAWLAEPSTQEALRAQGMIASPSTPEEFRQQIARELSIWARVVREAKITAD
jgi:tripartite-type tricarboxylate transporter receptor subunit TctC